MKAANAQHPASCSLFGDPDPNVRCQAPGRKARTSGRGWLRWLTSIAWVCAVAGVPKRVGKAFGLDANERSKGMLSFRSTTVVLLSSSQSVPRQSWSGYSPCATPTTDRSFTLAVLIALVSAYGIIPVARPTSVAALAPTCNGTRKTVQCLKQTENEPHDDCQRSLRW